MRRLMAGVSLLCLSLILGIGTIRATRQANDPYAVRRSILDPTGCPMPCWSGIRPGVTTIGQALQLLHDNPNLDPNSIQLLAPGEQPGAFSVNWRTPTAMLSGIHADVASQDVVIENMPGLDVVKVIIVHINVPLGDFLTLFGPPTRTSLGRLPGQNGDLFYVMEYPTLGMQYDVWTDCKQGQVIASLLGSTYLLQAPSTFISQVGSAENLGWHGFTARPFDQIAKENQCPSLEPQANGWFARLFGGG